MTEAVARPLVADRRAADRRAVRLRIIGHVGEQKRPQHTFNAGADGGLLGDLGAPQDLISLDEPREILCSLLRRKPREKLLCGASATPRHSSSDLRLGGGPSYAQQTC
jgi:hypothetical protein